MFLSRENKRLVSVLPALCHTKPSLENANVKFNFADGDDHFTKNQTLLHEKSETLKKSSPPIALCGGAAAGHNIFVVVCVP